MTDIKQSDDVLLTDTEEKEKLITRLAVVAVYEDDDEAFRHLKDSFGIDGYNSVLARARQHVDFSDHVYLAKKFTRLSLDKNKNHSSELREIEKSLEADGVNHIVIDDLSRVMPNDFSDILPFLSKETINFFINRKKEREDGAKRVEAKLRTIPYLNK
jgi:hypothetical protein